MKDTRVSVVICAYTMARWDDLSAAVASVRDAAAPPHELVVVIDHEPVLLERARRELSGCRVVPNAHARGLSGARNTGIRESTGEVVAFLDDDASADPGWLARLSDAYQADHVIGAGGGIIARWDTGRPPWWPDEFDWVVGCTYRGMPTEPADVRNAIGCNMSFRRSVFDRVGGFRDGIGRIGNVPVGCEETELSIRALRAFPGSVIRYLPDASVHHRVTPERATWRYFRSRCRAEGRSKALVARLVGADRALSTERTYTFRTLPAGVLRGFGALLRGDPSGVRRAGAIILGLGLTVSGYLQGRLSSADLPSVVADEVGTRGEA
jgi:glycosyltransferase involved in cell wall biosynthesis